MDFSGISSSVFKVLLPLVLPPTTTPSSRRTDPWLVHAYTSRRPQHPAPCNFTRYATKHYWRHFYGAVRGIAVSSLSTMGDVQVSLFLGIFVFLPVQDWGVIRRHASASRWLALLAQTTTAAVTDMQGLSYSKILHFWR